MRQFLGEREGLAYQTGNALPERVIEALNVVGFPGVLRHGLVLLRWYHPFIDGILVCMERRLFTVDHRNIGPKLLATLVAPIPHMEGNDLTRSGIHGHPDPWLVRLFLHQAPHC